jgi:hypothetical protein
MGVAAQAPLCEGSEPGKHRIRFERIQKGFGNEMMAINSMKAAGIPELLRRWAESVIEE